MKKSGNMEKAN